MLEHEKHFGAEMQNSEKKRKEKKKNHSHWSQNIVSGQIFQLIIRNKWRKNTVCPSAKI